MSLRFKLEIEKAEYIGKGTCRVLYRTDEGVFIDTFVAASKPERAVGQLAEELYKHHVMQQKLQAWRERNQ